MRSLLLKLLMLAALQLAAQDTCVVNDITGLNAIKVCSVITPRITDEIAASIRNHKGHISIGGGRYSMGGQTARQNALQIDMRTFSRVISFDKEKKVITVQSGITWRKLQEFIDPHDLSVSIMQTYANFTVGGSLSVNVHGRYVGSGPIVSSVLQIKMVLAGGDTITASPRMNSELFFGAIGGYGALGVITEVTLQLTENSRVRRTDVVMSVNQYTAHFFQKVRNDSLMVFHNGDLYPPHYKTVRAVSFRKTAGPVTVANRLHDAGRTYRFNRAAFRFISGSDFGKWTRQHVIDPARYRGNPVYWRNFEASYDVNELEPKNRRNSTYVLQEYFVPVSQFGVFHEQMAVILKKYDVNVLNVSIRHANADPGTLLAWARTEVFAFVIYYRQGTTEKDKNSVGNWTRELIDAALSCGGTFYLPYQLHATRRQFLRAYPAYGSFNELKSKYDPENKFRNKMWDHYNYVQ